MTKTELVSAVAEAVDGITKKKTAEVVEAVFANIHDTLAKGEKVQVVGFGTFEVRQRAAREGRNPQDPKKVVKIPAKKVPAFSAGKALKEAVNVVSKKKR